MSVKWLTSKPISTSACTPGGSGCGLNEGANVVGGVSAAGSVLGVLGMVIRSCGVLPAWRRRQMGNPKDGVAAPIDTSSGANAIALDRAICYLRTTDPVGGGDARARRRAATRNPATRL